MKIAMLNWRSATHSEAGGAEVVVDQEARGLSRRGHQVTLFTARDVAGNIETPARSYSISGFGNRFTVYPQVARWISRRDISAGFDVVFEHINGVPWFSPFWSRVPTACYLYHVVGRTFFEELPFPLSVLGYTAERLTPSLYRGVPTACLGQGSKSEFVKLGFGSEQLAVIPPGIDTEVYRPGSGKSAAPSVVAVGPIKHYKRLDLVIRGFAALRKEVPNATLSILGWARGQIYDELRMLVAAFQLGESVKFLGRVTTSAKVSVLQQSWCLVSASEREGWGLGIVEAAACGTPAVVPAIPGFRDTVIDEVTGLKYNPGDPLDMAEKLSRLIGNHTLLGGLATNALSRARSMTWESHVEAIERFLDDARHLHDPSEDINY